MRISHFLLGIVIVQGLAMAAYAVMGNHSAIQADARAEAQAIMAQPEEQRAFQEHLAAWSR